MINNDLLYYIPSGEFGKEGVLGLLKTHPEIRFVSLVGIDLAGNDTDEKVPIELFLKNYDDFFAGTAVQTDGSSVVLMNIATLNDARVDMVADASVNWYIDRSMRSRISNSPSARNWNSGSRHRAKQKRYSTCPFLRDCRNSTGRECAATSELRWKKPSKNWMLAVCM